MNTPFDMSTEDGGYEMAIVQIFSFDTSETIFKPSTTFSGHSCIIISDGKI